MLRLRQPRLSLWNYGTLNRERYIDDADEVAEIVAEISTMHKPGGDIILTSGDIMGIKLFDGNGNLIVELPFNNFYIYVDKFDGKDYKMIPFMMSNSKHFHKFLEDRRDMELIETGDD